MDVLRDNPELRPFVLSKVRLTGIQIGAGAYGSVEEVAIPGAICAAKKIHDVFLDRSEIPPSVISKMSEQFAQECKLMSTLRHPYIVQFLGVCFLPGSRLPALVMERLLTSLHDLLDPEIDPPPPSDAPKAFFPLRMKCSILHNVASGIAYLHERSPPIIHRDLSARNILLTSDMVAKVADLGVARIVPRISSAAVMTKAPGASVYMPPEATTPSAVNAERSKYDASIDIFSLGVVTIFTLGETFPGDPLPPTYTKKTGGSLEARTELQRRSRYMKNVNIQLRACGQLCGDHPLIQLIQQCLQNDPAVRPGIREVLHLLEEAIAGIRQEEREKNTQHLVEALQTQPSGNQNYEQIIQDLVTKNAVLQSRVQELQSSEREKQTFKQQLARLEVELARAEETIRREHQQKTELVQAKDKEAQQQLREKEEQLCSGEAVLLSYTCQVTGPGILSATVNHSTHVMVELTDSSGKSPSARQNVTVHIKAVSEEATPARAGRWPWSKKRDKRLSVAMTTPSQYKVSYTPVSRGQHKLHVQVNDREIGGSPLVITVYPDPTQLGYPMRTMTGLDTPYGIAVNSSGHMVVSEGGGHSMSIFDIRGQKIRSYYGDSPNRMISPAGIAIDDMDNIYVTSEHKLQKFSSTGELIKGVCQEGKKEGEFNDPRGITLYNSQVHVCDRNNHRIQVFDQDLNFVKSIGSYGRGKGNFDAPHDVKFDTAGNMYVAEFGNMRVQVMNISGQFIQSFGQKGEGKLGGPSGVQIADRFVYVTDFFNHCIVVYDTTGQFVTSFGKHGRTEGELYGPHSITSCVNGFIYVCDHWNNRVQIF